ncbi:MAG: XrtA/PEP-CTERM system TPR-repeat protein PrsT [Burkholderiales bacterium]
MSRSLALVFVLLTLATANAVVRADDAPREYEDALRRYDQGDAAGALIQVRNALQKNPKMLAAQILLGKLLLEKGDADGAADAFDKGLKLGVNKIEIAVSHAEALLLQGETDQLIKLYPPEEFPSNIRTELMVLRAHAYSLAGNLTSAESLYRDAHNQNPRHINALIAYAEFLIKKGNAKGVQSLAEKAVSIGPKDPRCWNLIANVAHLTSKPQAALEAYGKALSFNAYHVDARVSRTSLLLDMGRDAEAAKDIEFLQKEMPLEPRGQYLRALYLTKVGDPLGAKQALQNTLSHIDHLPPEALRRRAPKLVLLAGMANHGLGQTEKARTYLALYLKDDPRHVGVRKVLGSILLSAGDTHGATDMLEPAVKYSPNDPLALALLASAYQARGRTLVAAEYMERALRLSGDDPTIQATLGFGLASAGKAGSGVEHLRAAWEKNSKQGQVGFALTTLYMKQGNLKEALVVAEELAKGEPENLAVLNLLGAARGANRDSRGARQAYQRAVKIDSRFLPAQLNLARLDVMEHNEKSAHERLSRLQHSRPNNIQVMMELGRVEQAMGRHSEAIRWFEKVRAMDPKNVGVASELVVLYISRKNNAKALEVAQELEQVAPGNLLALEVIGRAYLANADAKNAQQVFDRMTGRAERDPVWQLRIAHLQLAAENPNGAVKSLESALLSNPDLEPAMALLSDLEIAHGQLDKAEKRAIKILAGNANPGLGNRIRGDVEMARQKYSAAFTYYMAAFQVQETKELALRLFRVHLANKEPKRGLEFLKSVSAKHPVDYAIDSALAEGYLLIGDLSSARSHYESALKKGGDNAHVLNNLANIAWKQKDGKALDYARQANQLSPENPVIQDTLGWLMLQQGDAEGGLRYLREARLRDPTNQEIRYHLALALTKLGRQAEAKKELEPIAQNPADFEGAEAARKLYQSL